MRGLVECDHDQLTEQRSLVNVRPHGFPLGRKQCNISKKRVEFFSAAISVERSAG